MAPAALTYPRLCILGVLHDDQNQNPATAAERANWTRRQIDFPRVGRDASTDNVLGAPAAYPTNSFIDPTTMKLLDRAEGDAPTPIDHARALCRF